MAHIAATTAAAVAAVARQRMLEEEEQMTPYSAEELNDDWEFKIVRANSEVFKQTSELQKLIEEEKRASWILLEKLDDSRVRFKRRKSTQSNDAQLFTQNIDPYRTHYGMSSGAYIALVLGGLFGFMACLFIMILASR